MITIRYVHFIGRLRYFLFLKVLPGLVARINSDKVKFGLI